MVIATIPPDLYKGTLPRVPFDADVVEFTATEPSKVKQTSTAKLSVSVKRKTDLKKAELSINIPDRRNPAAFTVTPSALTVTDDGTTVRATFDRIKSGNSASLSVDFIAEVTGVHEIDFRVSADELKSPDVHSLLVTYS